MFYNLSPHCQFIPHPAVYNAHDDGTRFDTRECNSHCLLFAASEDEELLLEDEKQLLADWVAFNGFGLWPKDTGSRSQ